MEYGKKKDCCYHQSSCNFVKLGFLFIIRKFPVLFSHLGFLLLLGLLGFYFLFSARLLEFL